MQLSCHVQAEPVASVRWYKDTLLLEQTHRRRMTTVGSKHVLLLTKLGPGGGHNLDILILITSYFQILAATRVMARIVLE